MRKLSVLPLLLLFASVAFAQENVPEKLATFEKAQSDPKAIPYGNNPAAGKFYQLRGFKMYCEIYGKGEPLLIIHGNGGSIDNFIYQIPYFASKYKVIIADSRSQGRSADPGDSLTYEMMADDYALLLDSLHIDSANVIGWSDGGINGLLLAMRHPKKVKKLAITGANLVADTTAVPQVVWDMVRPALKDLSANNKKTPQEKNAFKLLRLLCEQPNINPASLNQIACATLVIGGDHDVIKEEHTFLI
ncbi:MAG: alpha/beta fold hydrolase, partial [Chitinophagaceae bacterium]